MANAYHSEFEERSATKRPPAAPSLGKPAPAPKARGETEPNWMGKARGPKRTVFPSFGRKVKTRVHEDF